MPTKSKVKEQQERRATYEREMRLRVSKPILGLSLMEIPYDELRDLDEAIHWVLHKHNIRRQAARMAKQRVKKRKAKLAPQQVLEKGPWDKTSVGKRLTKQIQKAEKERLEALKAQPRSVKVIKREKPVNEKTS